MMPQLARNHYRQKPAPVRYTLTPERIEWHHRRAMRLSVGLHTY
jgi:hypothetical protein